VVLGRGATRPHPTNGIYVPRSIAEAGDGEASSRQGGREAAAPLSTESDLSKLTKRQREVLQLLARGMSNKQIARALKIAEATTKIHMAALLRALGARNRTEAAYKAGNLINLTGLDHPVLVRGQNVETSAASDYNISLQTAPGLRKELRRDSSVGLRKVGVQ